MKKKKKVNFRDTAGNAEEDKETPLSLVTSYQWLEHWYCSGYPARRLALKSQGEDWLALC